MLRRRNRRKNSAFAIPEISLTPLIDTALTLLIIFMITSPMMRMTIRVDLPESSTKSSSRAEDESLVVDVDHNGNLYFGGVVMSLAQLQARIKEIAQKNPANNIVYINGDRTLKYQEIVKLIDVLNTIDGIKHVALVTQKATS